MQILIVKENFKDMDKLNKLAKEAFPLEEYLPARLHCQNGRF